MVIINLELEEQNIYTQSIWCEIKWNEFNHIEKHITLRIWAFITF